MKKLRVVLLCRNIELALILLASVWILQLGLRSGDARIAASVAPLPWKISVFGPQTGGGAGSSGKPAEAASSSPIRMRPFASRIAPPRITLLSTATETEIEQALSTLLPPEDLRPLAARVARRMDEAGWWEKTHLSLSALLAESKAGHRGQVRPLSPDQLQKIRNVVVVRSAETARETWRIYLWAFPTLFVAAHLALRFCRRRGGEFYLPAVLLFSSFTAIVLYQFQDPLRDNMLAFAFAEGVAVAMVGLVAAAGFIRLSTLEDFKYITILSALGLSLLLILYGSGPEGTDTRINLFGFQPVEFIKLMVVLFLAAYLSDRENELKALNAFRLGPFSIPRIRDVLPVAIFMCTSLAFFFVQKDLGPAMVLYLVFVCLFASIARRLMLGLAGLAVLTTAFWLAYRHSVFQTVSTRIEMWLSPWDNHRPGGVQLAESLWALASGGRAGSGPGLSSPNYIPAGHTDLILASCGEVFGFPAVALLLAGSTAIFVMMIYHAYQARHAYASGLGFGLALLFGVQAAVISAASLGILPLTGIPFPLLGYGKSATIATFILIGLMINIASRRPPGEPRPVRLPAAALVVPAVIAAALILAAGKAWVIMGPSADAILVKPCLVPQGDGVRRYACNRRLTTLAALIPRGAIRDCRGVPLALNDPLEAEEVAPLVRALGGSPPAADGRRRVQPFGPLTVHLLGCTQDYWSDQDTVEKKFDTHLRGYPYSERVEVVGGVRIVKPDYSGLAGPFRDRALFPAGRLGDILRQDRDVRLSLDIRIQAAAARALQNNFPEFDGVRRSAGAAVVLNALTGDILACLSLPGYDPNIPPTPALLQSIYGPGERPVADRCRKEIYPPGSTFKVVTAAAALWKGLSPNAETIDCRHKNVIPWTYDRILHKRSVTDDETESAHGRIAMPRALIESCNVYFAWLGTRVGAPDFFSFCKKELGLTLPAIPNAAAMDVNLPDNAYGQALVAVTPMEMAAVAAMVRNDGRRVVPGLTLYPEEPKPGHLATLLPEEAARQLRSWMVSVTVSGTGRQAAVEGLVTGGKTGTAQTASGDGRSHAWFIGFADPPPDPGKYIRPEKPERPTAGKSAGADAPPATPADRPEPGAPVAFAFLLENSGYGGRAAAPAARDLLTAMRDGALFPARPVAVEPTPAAEPPSGPAPAVAKDKPAAPRPAVKKQKPSPRPSRHVHKASTKQKKQSVHKKKPVKATGSKSKSKGKKRRQAL